MNSQLIPILSLIIAGLSVFFGPLITLSIARRQLQLSKRLSEKQIISPIRQAWINELRIIISELAAKAHHYTVAGYEDREDAEYLRITQLLHQLRLYLNPMEDDHNKLIKAAKDMSDNLSYANSESETRFWYAHEQVMIISQQILKREWDRVKKDV